jgi:hypothetical protein
MDNEGIRSPTAQSFPPKAGWGRDCCGVVLVIGHATDLVPGNDNLARMRECQHCHLYRQYRKTTATSGDSRRKRHGGPKVIVRGERSKFYGVYWLHTEAAARGH